MTTPPTLHPDSALCPGCGAPNRCAIAAGAPAADCWCMAAPRGLPLTDADRCWCPRCLKAQTVALTRPTY